MGRRKAVPLDPKETTSRPALTAEARENQLIALATDLAEQQLRAGTASSQVITHYLKLASSKERLEKEILEKQKELITAKTESIQAAQHSDELYKKAIAAMQRYTGHGGSEYDDEDYEDFIEDEYDGK